MNDHEKNRELVEDGFLTVKEGAGFLNISHAAIYAMMTRGKLPYVKLG